MYNLGPALESRSVDPGTNLLVSGPPLSGARDLAFRSLAHGVASGEAALVVTTRYSARRVLADLSSLTSLDDAAVGIVDCVTRRQDRAHTDDSRVNYVSSPGALTRIGIEFSAFLKEFDTQGVERIRVVLDSLSTMLPYADTQSVFKFGYVLAEQVADAGGVGLHLIGSTAHDPSELRTLEELFDGEMTVEAGAVTGFED